MSFLPVLATIAGTAVSAAGSIAAGRAQERAAEHRAQQLEIKAKEEKAAAQRESMQLRRRKELAISSAQARAGASGFDPGSSGTLDIIGEIERYGTLQEQTALYGGLSREQGLLDSATGERITGASQRTAGYYDAAGTILGGISSMARYRT